MDVRCLEMESACRDFNQLFIGQSSKILHVSFTTVEPQNQSLSTISSHYDWHVNYWAEKLNLRVSSRMKSGISEWVQKDKPHREFLSHHRVPFKTDLTRVLRDKVEILSVATSEPLSVEEHQQFLQVKSAVAFYANKFWLQRQVPRLPFKANHSDTSQSPTSAKIVIKQTHCQFADVILTAKEMSTIKMLLSLKTPKEIAWCHQCSESAERKRIEDIKRKLGCTGKPKSKLFETFIQYGIAQACWESYTT